MHTSHSRQSVHCFLLKTILRTCGACACDVCVRNISRVRTAGGKEPVIVNERHKETCFYENVIFAHRTMYTPIEIK